MNQRPVKKQKDIAYRLRLKFMSVHIQKSLELQQRLSQSRTADHGDVKVAQSQQDFRVVDPGARISGKRGGACVTRA